MRDKIRNWLLLAGTCLLIVAIDQLVLFVVGQTRWQYDPVLGYRLRSNWQLVSYTGAMSTTNKWGHYDDDFALQKPARQLRGLMIGDSVTMGVHLPREQSFANQLEDLLQRFDSRHACYQMINTGTEGYDTSQERQMLTEALRFDPDFIVIGYCLNDIIEPYLLNRDLGSTGRFSGMQQATFPLWGYLINETGFGRLVVKMNEDRHMAEDQHRYSLYSVERMVQSADAAHWTQGWNSTLAELETIYGMASERQIPIVLALFPYTFQLFRSDWQSPQQRLALHAEQHRVDWIDATSLFEKASHMRLYRNLLQADTAPIRPDEKGELTRFAAQVYFRDFNHFTAAGHQLVALQLTQYLSSKGLVDIEPEAFAQYQQEQNNLPIDFDRRLSSNLESLRDRQRLFMRLGLVGEAEKIATLIEAIHGDYAGNR